MSNLRSIFLSYAYLASSTDIFSPSSTHAPPFCPGVTPHVRDINPVLNCGVTAVLSSPIRCMFPVIMKVRIRKRIQTIKYKN